MIFEILLAAGALGFVATALMGIRHAGHGQAHAGHGHAAHAIGHGAHSGGAHPAPAVHVGGHHMGHAANPAGHGHAAHTGGAARLDTGQHSLIAKVNAPEQSGLAALRFIPSPVDLFSIAMGAGATGILLQPHTDMTNAGIAAAVGGVVFNFLIVRPLFSFGLRFASNPSEGLEGTVAHTAEAITKFDETGKGLVRVELDGQFVQLLAKLDREEQARGICVSKGDTVVMTEVDPRAGICQVSRELME